MDVGANVGTLSLIAAKIAKEVIAFEPVPKTLERLRSNVELNNLKNIVVIPKIISDDSGKAIIHALVGANKTASVNEVSEPFESFECEAVTLDEYLSGKKVDFIKIDTDGHDRNVLVGARSTIEKHRPVIVYEEVAESVSKYTPQDIKQMFNELNYNQVQIGKINILCLPG